MNHVGEFLSYDNSKEYDGFPPALRVKLTRSKDKQKAAAQSALPPFVIPRKFDKNKIP